VAVAGLVVEAEAVVAEADSVASAVGDLEEVAQEEIGKLIRVD
jgi:hypothetical protein